MEGYPGHHKDITQYRDQFRFLLFHNKNFNQGKFPNVNVFFTRKLWNVSVG